MTNPTPKIDARTAADVSRQVVALLREHYAPGWRGYDPQTLEPTGVSAALIGVFSRYAEIIIRRLNRAPDKNFLAFLDLLGASLQPPAPARAPLTFYLAAGSATDALVPAGTQVAAEAAPGESKPATFETERELLVTTARLASVWSRDPAEYKHANLGALAEGAGAAAALPAFRGVTTVEHDLYVAHDLYLGHPALKELQLAFDLDADIPAPDARTLRWELWDGAAWVAVAPTSDTTAALTRDGSVVFGRFAAAPAPQAVGGVTSRWLRCRLLTPVTASTSAQAGRVRQTQLPRLRTVRLRAELERADMRAEAAATNQAAADLTKDFFPFGEKPRFGDAFYLAHREAFSEEGASVTVTLNLTNTVATAKPKPPAASSDLRLRWEYWDGATWVALGDSVPTADTVGASFNDTTRALTRSGAVTFVPPTRPAPTAVAGVENYWVRARIVTGDYGVEARYARKRDAAGNVLNEYEYVEATFAPPSLQPPSVGYTLVRQQVRAEAVFTSNSLDLEDVTAAAFDPARVFQPFKPIPDARPTLYLGFTLPPGRAAFPNGVVSLYLGVADVAHGTPPDAAAGPAPPRVAWECRTARGWTPLLVRDGTGQLTRRGIVEFLAPADFAPSREFGQERFWLRARNDGGAYRHSPRLGRVLPNTTMAAQTSTLADEALGSSDSSASQRFRASRAPVLLGPRLEVREPERPQSHELRRIEEEEGPDAVTPAEPAAGGARADDDEGRAREVWVRWHEVADFYASGPRDRHYVLDHVTGEVLFGDGRNGMIPPRGAGNVRLRSYRSGGGSAGNKPAGSITRLKTTVPYVSGVTNHEPAAGGADAETHEALLQRAPLAIRHGGRAVTVEDFTDLAALASPEVARALCVPLYDLEADPAGAQKRLGSASVIVVPRSQEAKPLPSMELIDRVRAYLDARRPTALRLAVVGPEYVRVDVEAEVAVTSLEAAGEVEAAVRAELARYLHPLTGGAGRVGWRFGRKPRRSDLFAVVEAVAGVDHVRRLRLVETEERAGAGATDRFLVYSGSHAVSLTYVGG